MEEDSGLSPGQLPTDTSAQVNTYYKRWYPKAKEENGCWDVTRLQGKNETEPWEAQALQSIWDKPGQIVHGAAWWRRQEELSESYKRSC